jgi:hypothetical protein
MNNPQWLNEGIVLEQNNFKEFLSQYFSSLGLNAPEIDTLQDIYVRHILGKSQERRISFRELYFEFSKIFKNREDDTDIITEVYAMLSKFYEFVSITNKRPTFS